MKNCEETDGIMEYKSLAEMNRVHQQRVNELPIRWAFSDKQLEEVLEEWNVTVDDCMGFCGGIIRKADKEMIIKVFDQNASEEKEFRKEKKNLVETFINAMRETEYGYTDDDEEVLRYCGYDWNGYYKDDFIKAAFKSAKKKYMKSAV